VRLRALVRWLVRRWRYAAEDRHRAAHGHVSQAGVEQAVTRVEAELGKLEGYRRPHVVLVWHKDKRRTG
jgi:hypothetical protein